MTDAIITNPQDLQYISNIVSQVLDNHHYLADIKDVQTALKEVSLEHGQEVQINLVFEENQLTGFNFSLKSDLSKTTPTIAFKQNQINIDSEKGDVIPYIQTATTINVAATESKGNIAIPSPSPSEIILTPGLQVEDQHIINPDSPENDETIETQSSGFGKINPDLIGAAHQLVNQHEINGLLLTGLTLKTGISLTETLQPEEKPDIQTAGLAIIKRFQQVLTEEFIALKAGDSPSSFNWKDPKSNKQYHFYFEAVQTNNEGNILIPASLKGFEKLSENDVMQPIFTATLIDAKYNHWSIEQCDFNKNQIQSLNLATKPISPIHTTAITNTVGDFCSEI
jgi:hypothetical protein